MIEKDINYTKELAYTYSGFHNTESFIHNYEGRTESLEQQFFVK